MFKNDRHTILVAGDTHFKLRPDPDEVRRRDLFLSFLEAARDADELVLLGDIFDFWFDYPHFRLRGYEELLSALDGVRDAGVRLHFVGGNHDIWAARYLHERYGTSPHGEPFTLDAGGLRIRLVHGDGLLVRDWLYSSFRRLVRQRAGVLFAKSLHPELLYAFSHWLSHASRQASRDERHLIEKRARRHLARARGDWDLLLIGHVHHAFRIAEGGREMAALGSWFGGEASYAIVQGGRFELRDFAAEPRPPVADPQ